MYFFKSASLQVCAAVSVRSWQSAGSLAVELRHGTAVSGGPGAPPLQHQQGGEQDGESRTGGDADPPPPSVTMIITIHLFSIPASSRPLEVKKLKYHTKKLIVEAPKISS